MTRHLVLQPDIQQCCFFLLIKIVYTYRIQDTQEFRLSPQNPNGKVSIYAKCQNSRLDSPKEAHDSSARVLAWVSPTNIRLNKEPRGPQQCSYKHEHRTQSPSLCPFRRAQPDSLIDGLCLGLRM